ncbi:MAG: T9SS type A sorting domain-containing protein [Chitinophagales bacterium]|nr:T9SS type A sorting domain-containing protein [Chitinophagales bacterium]
MGYQDAASGNSYAGIVNANIYPTPFSDREYIGCLLNESLQIGKKYFIRFKASPAYKIPDPILSVECFSNNIGFRFSNVSFSSTIPPETDNTAHFYYPLVINDTANWTSIVATFTADSAFSYLIIGNFFDNEHTTFICDSTLSYSTSYLYIDDICVSLDSLTCLDLVGVVNLHSNSSVRIYPNPAKESITITGSKIQSFILSDLQGNIVYQYFPLAVSTTLIVSGYQRGIYLLKINMNEKSFFQKIILQ